MQLSNDLTADLLWGAWLHHDLNFPRNSKYWMSTAFDHLFQKNLNKPDLTLIILNQISTCFHQYHLLSAPTDQIWWPSSSMLWTIASWSSDGCTILEKNKLGKIWKMVKHRTTSTDDILMISCLMLPRVESFLVE